jgi:hypothetical protein
MKATEFRDLREKQKKGMQSNKQSHFGRRVTFKHTTMGVDHPSCRRIDGVLVGLEIADFVAVAVVAAAVAVVAVAVAVAVVVVAVVVAGAVAGIVAFVAVVADVVAECMHCTSPYLWAAHSRNYGKSPQISI